MEDMFFGVISFLGNVNSVALSVTSILSFGFDDRQIGFPLIDWNG